MSSTLKYFTRTFDSVGILKVARILLFPNCNQNMERWHQRTLNTFQNIRWFKGIEKAMVI